jgi:hypothetical protein
MNPFDATRDPDRHAIWQMLVLRDSEAFVAQDWSKVADDFDAENFEGIRCANSTNPDEWRIVFPRLENYRDAWLSAARDFATKSFPGMTPLDALLARCRLEQIDIEGEMGLAHKKFLDRQTLYRLRRRVGRWKIVGFLGYLPLVPSRGIPREA